MLNTAHRLVYIFVRASTRITCYLRECENQRKIKWKIASLVNNFVGFVTIFTNIFDFCSFSKVIKWEQMCRRVSKFMIFTEFLRIPLIKRHFQSMNFKHKHMNHEECNILFATHETEWDVIIFRYIENSTFLCNQYEIWKHYMQHSIHVIFFQALYSASFSSSK